MKNFQNNKTRLGSMMKYFLLITMLFCSYSIAQAQVVEDVDIAKNETGMELRLNFAFPVQYIGHVVSPQGNVVRIQFKVGAPNALSPKDVQALSERTDVTWDHSADIPLEEIFWEGNNASSPVLTLIFNQRLDFAITGAKDFRSLMVQIKSGLNSSREAVIGDGETETSKYAPLLQEAMEALRANDYVKAIRLLTKVESLSKANTHRRALEYLGLARQRNRQLAHAKAEYKKFLKLYPDGPDAVRVQQRLSALMTADKEAQPKLRQSKLVDAKEEGAWNTSVYGSLSQFYFRDETRQNGLDKRVNISSLNTDADLNLRARNKDYEFRFQFVGSHQNNFIEGKENRKRLSRLYMEFQDRKHGAHLRVGRQSKSSGGVLGRFDGVDAGYDITSAITLNAKYGYPVQSSRQTNINTDRRFYGASIDFETFSKALDITTYFIEQKNKGLLDRRAVGGEIRYYKDGKSLFSMVDYDLHFKELNLLMLNGNWMVSKDTTVYMSLDYRKSPLLTTTNAIQGQGVENLSDLFTVYTEDELFLFAEDRTSSSKTATFGLNQKLSEKFQLSVDLTATQFEGTQTSGGVIGYPGTGTEYYTSLQLLGSSLIADNDSHTLGVRYNDRERDRTYSVYLNSRFRISKSFRINPRVRVDYRASKLSDDTRFIVRPLLKLDYRVGKWLRLEVEGGWEWRDQTFSGIKQTSTGNYIYAGYRAIF